MVPDVQCDVRDLVAARPVAGGYNAIFSLGIAALRRVALLRGKQ